MSARRRSRGKYQPFKPGPLLKLTRRMLVLLFGTRGGRWASLVVLLLLAGVWAYDEYLRPRYPTGPTIRIATWNLRHFTGEREDFDLEAVADVIEAEDFALLAIQEVRGDGSGVDLLAAELNGPLSQRWRTLVSNETGNSEHFAYLYDSDRVRHLGDSGFLTARLDLDRRPYAATFQSGNFDFTLVTIHLYYSDLERRREEARQLADLLTGRTLPAGSGERDVIVLGDFNTTRRDGGTLSPFEALGWLVLNEEPTNLGDGETLDNVVIDPDATIEWAGVSGVVRFDETLYANDDEVARKRLSDHRPVWADFVVNLADDD